MSWEVVIGLEVHVQLATQSKIFSGSSTEFGAEPNTQASLIDLGMPGVLPVLNADAVEKAVKFGLGIEAEITPKSVFARKNYFYPDLPKGYQISQFELPIVGMGHIEITLDDGETKRIGVTRAHLEEDAGKSLHEDFHGMSGIDLNRAGTPLLEIVSEPDMRSAKEAVAYAKAIHSLIRYLGISDGDMSQGSMRCDCNVSLRQKGEEKFGTRREIKNVNSFKNVEKAINAEIEWQMDELESGREIQQATVLYDVNKDKTFAMRSKEEANDYRYFPDPDLLPLEVTEAVINRIRQDLPELPTQKIERFMAELELSDYDARVLASDRVLADYFETVVKESGAKPKLCANWVSVELLGALNKNDLDIDTSPVSAEQLGGLVKRIADNTISGKIAKQIFEELWNSGGTADGIIEAKGLKQETDTGAIEAIVDQVIADSADQVAQYLAADDNKRKKLIGYFVGQTMKLSKGKANPQMVNQILAKKLV